MENRGDVSMIENELPAQPTQPSQLNQAPIAEEDLKLAQNADQPETQDAQAAGQGRANNSRPAKKLSKDSLETPEELSQTYKYISKLGEGTYGVVYKANDLR